MLHIRSKAFSRSKNMAPMVLFSKKAMLISEDSLTSWSIVDLCFRKPDWLFEMRLFPLDMGSQSKCYHGFRNFTDSGC